MKIAEFAHDVDHNGVDLVMIPTHGCGLFRSLLLGSVTAKVLHDVQCPVWTATHAEEQNSPQLPKTIMCAVDGTPKTPALLQWAVEFSRQMGATLRLLHVVPPITDWAALPGEEELQEEVRNEARAKIDDLKRSVGIDLPVRISVGPVVATAVTEQAREESADLILIGTRIAAILAGAFADACVRDYPARAVSGPERLGRAVRTTKPSDAEHRARRLADDPVGMGAEAPERLIEHPAANDHQVSVSDAGPPHRRASPTSPVDMHSGAWTPTELCSLPIFSAACFRNSLSNSGSNWRPGHAASPRMACTRRRVAPVSFENSAAQAITGVSLGSPVDRAHHVAPSHVLLDRRLFHVRTGPHRALRVVQNLGGDRTEQKPAERTISVRRHHDQVHAFGDRELGDHVGRFPRVGDPLHTKICEFRYSEVIQLPLEFAFPDPRCRPAPPRPSPPCLGRVAEASATLIRVTRAPKRVAIAFSTKGAPPRARAGKSSKEENVFDR